MSFPARVFRALIASPSDVTDEREIAVKTIQEWNDLNAKERQIVILPIRWETHTAPDYGKRPQEFINYQIVDHCDLLIGIFWTKIGSPSGFSDSGTIEEIERVATSGKPIMLYFSQAKQDPDKLDLDQLSKLREFKKKTLPHALVQNYSNQIEFKEKLLRQLDIQIRSIFATNIDGDLQSSYIQPTTDIILEFAEFETGKSLGSDIVINSRYIGINNYEEIPDYVLPKKENIVNATGNALLTGWLNRVDPIPNKNYLRQLVTYKVLNEFFKPIRFWLKNRGGVGARDVFIDINIDSNSESIVVISKDKLPTMPSENEGFSLLSGSSMLPSKPEDIILENSKGWRVYIEEKALQPQRELSPTSAFLVGAMSDCEITFRARIFADTLSEPLTHELHLTLKVTKVDLDVTDLFEELKENEKKSG